MMRVLLVVHGFPPSGSGGTEIYVHDFAHALAKRPGTDVAVLTRDADAARPEYDLRVERMGRLQVFRINNTFQACTSFEDSYANPELAAVASGILGSFAPDVLHVQHLTCLSTGILDAAEAQQIPVVLTLNDYWLICHRGQLLDRQSSRCDGPFERGCARCIPPGMLATPTAFRAGRLLRAMAPSAVGRAVQIAFNAGEAATPEAWTRDASLRRLRHMQDAVRSVRVFLAPSGTIADWFLRFGIPPSRLRRCDQGIDLTPFRERARSESSVLRLGFAGSLIASKAPHLVLEAAGMLPAGSITVDLLGTAAPYHGDDRYATRLTPLLGNPALRTLGPVPHERMANALTDIDVLVVPSVWVENAPFIIREAFAAGVPVVAARLGGMAEMVRHEQDGLLFCPDDARALASALRRLLEEPGLLARLRAGIRTPMSIDEDAARVAGIYAEVCGGSLSAEIEPVSRRVAAGRTAPAAGVAAVILNYRTPDQTWLAAHSLRTSFATPERIVIVDNGSDDRSVEALPNEVPGGVEVIATGANLGFPGGCNAGIRAALDGGAGFVLLVNSDAVLAPDALARLLDVMARDPESGIVAPVLLSREEPDHIASAGITFSTRTCRMRHIAAGGRLGMLPTGGARTVDAVSGCVMLIRSAVFERVGLLDEDYFYSFEDIDFCLRARSAGFRVLCVPGAIAYHEGGRSIGRRSPDRVYYATRNHLRLAERRDAGPRPAVLRSTLIVAANAVFALLSGETPKVTGLAAVARGLRHHARGRYGPA